jgi:hypothetical protein
LSLPFHRLSIRSQDFQRAYARREWAAQRHCWRSVIQLNLLRNVNDILELVARELSEITFPTRAGQEGQLSEPTPPLTEKHQLLKLKLAPVRDIYSPPEPWTPISLTHPPLSSFSESRKTSNGN